MKKRYNICFILFIISSSFIVAQDKLFLRDGSVINCKISSINEHTISYKDTSQLAVLVTVSKEKIMMAEFKSGEIYVFGKTNSVSTTENKIDVNETREERKQRKMKEWKEYEGTLSNNIIGIEPGGFFAGRYGVSYERLIADKSIGIKIPFILSANYLDYLAGNGSNGGSPNTNNSSPSFITGLDINFYSDIMPKTKWYFGPRIRVGKDALLGGLEGYTAQLQNGLMVSQGKVFTNTIGVGFGFFQQTQIFSNTVTSTVYNKQFYPSVSVTWRLGFRI